MGIWTILVTAVASTASALIGAFTGGWLTRRGEDRKWFREKQLEGYRELFKHYLAIKVMLRRANLDRSGYDYDWAAWGAASLMAQLMAPRSLAVEIKKFHSAVDGFLANAARDTINDPLSPEALAEHESRLDRAEDELRVIVEESLTGKPR
jgi:hypothetical protein